MRRLTSAAPAAILAAAFLTLGAGGNPESPPAATDSRPRLLIRIDDVGFCHGANAAAERILSTGVCTSVSVIVNTPWLDEAVEVLKRHPDVSIGVHLTLNAEWREYRWGPVRPYSEVPSLVDTDGRFFPSQRAFLENRPKIGEVEKELRAQIELARRKGLPVSYLDDHMGTATCTPEFRQLVERLAAEYKLGLSGYFGEAWTPSIYETAPGDKLPTTIQQIEQLADAQLHALLIHPGTNAPEMAAMTDLNPTKAKPMAAHRQAEADVLCDAAFRAALERRGVRLVGYRELCAAGLERMKRPEWAEHYAPAVPAASQPGESRP